MSGGAGGQPPAKRTGAATSGRRLRVGVLGVGNIAPLNVRGYLEHPRCDVVALCDIRQEKAARMATQWGVPKVYTDLDAFLADDDIDAVEILTPTYLHHEHVLAALDAGKHVSCQKPLANSVDEARQMARAAEDAGLVLRVSECYIHYPPLLRAKELVRSGAIGSPTTIRVKTVVGRTDSGFQRSLEPEGYLWRFDEHSPGGHLFDDMVHKYALLLWLADTPVRSVQSVVRRGMLFFEAPTAAIFEYERDDLLGMLDVAHAPRLAIPSDYYGGDTLVEIQGTDGLIWVTRIGGRLLGEAPIVWFDSDGRHEEHLESDWALGFTDASRHFVDALLDGEPAAMAPELAIETLQLCFAVYLASARREPVDPSTIETSVSPPWWPLTWEQILERGIP